MDNRRVLPETDRMHYSYGLARGTNPPKKNNAFKL